jgi:cytochrome b6-f complex iron-sulfur subunit
MKATSKTMNRQEFFRLMGLSAGAIYVSGCVSKADDVPLNADALDMTIQLDDVRYSDLQKKGNYVVVNNRVIVANVQSNQFVAVAPKCTHEGTTLSFQANSNSFYCGLDGSRYDLTGKVITGPATKPLTVYSVANDQKTNSLRIFN